MLPENTVAKIELVLPRESLVLNAGQAVRGVVFFRQGASAFPMEGWHDFAATLLVGWLSALQKLASGEETRTELFFMEGPYQVDLEMAAATAVTVTCVDRFMPEVRRQSVQDFPALADAVCEAGSAVLDWTASIGLRNRETGELRALLAGLRAQTGG